jgi:archaellum component FlaC
LEKQLYKNKEGKVTNSYLQQLCCHPMVIDSNKKIYGNAEVDLSLMQDKLIEYHKKTAEDAKAKIEKLDPKNQAYHMLKKNFEGTMNESNYLYKILSQMKNKEID